jgi:alpha-D-xyloside xylohydrolase
MGDYIQDLMRRAHEKGVLVMPTCLCEFSGDKVCWEVEDQDVFGSQYLVAPILEPGQRRKVYLPRGGRVARPWEKEPQLGWWQMN